MKKLLTGIALAAATACMSVSVLGATFSDVEDTPYSWAQPYIEEMAEQKLISGYEDGTFKPGKTVSRIETISLFARAMGSREDINAKTLSIAMEKYADVIDGFELNFGAEDVAYMLYRGVLTEAEATAYLKDDAKNEPMKRFEAATIITKAMGAEAEAKRNLVMDLEYTDVSEIPSSAKKYVYYVTEKEIMSGMGDNTFSPNTDVLRSQIAVMLSNTVGKMELSVNSVKINAIDTDSMQLTAVDDGDEEYKLSYTEDSAFFIEGEKSQAKQIPEGVRAIVALVGDEVMYVDIHSTVPDQVIEAMYVSYQSVEGKISITVRDAKTKDNVSYPVNSSSLKVVKAGNNATIRDIKEGDFVTVTLTEGEVVRIEAINKDEVIRNAVIEAIDHTSDAPTITISHADEAYDGKVFVIGNNVEVIKDGNVTDMNSVYRGDNASITLEYGELAKIVATGNRKTVEGTIREIKIAENPAITVMVNGSEVTYDVTKDIKITVNGEDADLYAFRVGDKVTLTTESEAVIKIASTSTITTSGNATGTVTSVNNSYKFIKLLVTDASGASYEETIYCKDNKTTFITAQGQSKAFKDIVAGSVISAYGTITNGAFEATSVIIVSDAK